MNEIYIGPRKQLLGWNTEGPLPRWIDSLEISVETRDAKHIERECKELIELFFRAAALSNRLRLVRNASAEFYLRHHQPAQRFQCLFLVRRQIPRNVI